MALVESIDHSQRTHVYDSDGMPLFGAPADIADMRPESEGPLVLKTINQVMGQFAVENVLPNLPEPAESTDSQG